MPNEHILIQGLSNEIRHHTQAVWLTDFFPNTNPLIRDTALPYIGQRLVATLAGKLCVPDVHGNVGVIRGGSIRSSMLHEADIDNHFAKLSQGIDPRLLGDHPLASAVIEKAFGLKDVDIWLRIKEPHSEATKKDLLFQEIMACLQKIGATGYMSNDHQAALSLRGYQVKLKKHYEGTKNKQPLVKVDFIHDGRPIFKLHFGVIPNAQEMLENIRWGDGSADGDLLAMGYLSFGHLNTNAVDNYDVAMLVRYFAENDMTILTKEVLTNYFTPLSDPLRVRRDKNFLQEYARKQRESNFRASYYPALFQLRGAALPYYELFLKLCMLYDFKKPNKNQLIDWIKEGRNEINNLLILPLTDSTFGTVNPFVHYLFLFPKHTLKSTLLGDILDEPKQILSLLDFIAKRIGGRLTDSLVTLSWKYLTHCKSLESSSIFMLLDWLQQNGQIPENRQVNFSDFLHFVNPLELTPQPKT